MTTKKAFGVIVLLTIVGLIYNYKHLGSYPSHIHAWAQADRYALAVGFTENNLNFFKPQTYIYNHQFPGEWKAAGPSRITAVDFPIHDFIPAVIMKLTGSQSPLIFRLYIFIYSLIGLFFLFKLAYAITQCFYRSLFISLAAASSPVFVYYQAGFLPTVPSVANLLIGLYFYFQHLKQNDSKNFYLSVLFATLAALARSTFVIPLISMVGVETVRFLMKDARINTRHGAFLISGLIICSYQIYNVFLRSRYGSDFLNHLLPPAGLDSAKEMVVSAFKNWGLQYFTGYHYFIFITILFIASFYFFTRPLNIARPAKWLVLYILISTAGYFGFSILMLQQFPNHDYYFLDTFFISVILIITFCLGMLPIAKYGATKLFRLLILVLMLILIYQPIRSQKFRYNSSIWSKTQATVENFKNSAALLDSAGVSENERLLVLDAVAPNLPFALMKRAGYAVMDPSKENINRAMQWPFGFIVMQNEYLFNELSYTFPEMLPKLQRVAGNNNISLYRLSQDQNENPASIIKKNGIPVFSSMVDFEGDSSQRCINLKSSGSVSYSGQRSGHITPEDGFGITFRYDNLPELKTNSISVFVTFQMLRQKADGCILVVKINSNNRSIHYREFDLQQLPLKESKWQPVELMFNLPRIAIENSEFSVYLWNPGGSEMFYDNFGVEITK